MSQPGEQAAQSHRVFVVALEYRGANVAVGMGGLRVPVLEHAYEVGSGRMPAHPRRPPRIAFPDPGRGWPARPHAPRCGSCTLAMTELIRDAIAELFNAARERMTALLTDMSDQRVWLYPAMPA